MTVAQVMGFVDATEVPRQSGNILRLVIGEVIGAEHNLIADKGIRGILPPQVLAVHHGHGKPEFFSQLINPLRNQAGREDNQDFTFTLRPMSVDDDTRLNDFTEPDFIGENRPLISRRAFRARLTAEIWYGIGLIRMSFNVSARLLAPPSSLRSVSCWAQYFRKIGCISFLCLTLQHNDITFLRKYQAGDNRQWRKFKRN